MSEGAWKGLLGCGVILILCLLSHPVYPQSVEGDDPWTGHRIMNEVHDRHKRFPYVYEEQSMILRDRSGNRDVRKARRFSELEEDGTFGFLLVFDTPAEVRGVALLETGHSSGGGECGIYLPAFGKKLMSQAGRARGAPFLGTDFAIEDLTSEVISDFRYVRVADQKVDLAACFVVEAFPQNGEVVRTTGYSVRRHFIRQDNFFIVRTDYYDRRKQLFKRQTFHDLKKVGGDIWQADMALMKNLREMHETLIKINRRVFSRDYVPPEMFTPAWLLENRHIQISEKRLFQEDPRSLRETEEEFPDSR